MTALELAREAIVGASDLAGNAKGEDYPATMALVGIGQALIAIAEQLETIEYDLARKL